MKIKLNKIFWEFIFDWYKQDGGKLGIGWGAPSGHAYQSRARQNRRLLFWGWSGERRETFCRVCWQASCRLWRRCRCRECRAQIRVSIVVSEAIHICVCVFVILQILVMIAGTRRCFRSTRAFYRRILKGLWHRVGAPQMSLTMHSRRIMMARRHSTWTLSWRRMTTWTSSTWWSTTRRSCESYRKPRLEAPQTRPKLQPLMTRNNLLLAREIQPSERSSRTKDTKVDRGTVPFILARRAIRTRNWCIIWYQLLL